MFVMYASLQGQILAQEMFTVVKVQELPSAAALSSQCAKLEVLLSGAHKHIPKQIDLSAVFPPLFYFYVCCSAGSIVSRKVYLQPHICSKFFHIFTYYVEGAKNC